MYVTTRAECGSQGPVGPASVLLETACPDPAAVVEQTLTDLSPSRVRPIEPNGIEALDLDGPAAAGAVDSEELPRDLRQPHLLEGQPRLSGGARVPEDAFPIFLGQSSVRRGIVDTGGPQRAVRQFFHLLCGRHSP
jgi:hypothetical protein